MVVVGERLMVIWLGDRSIVFPLKVGLLCLSLRAVFTIPRAFRAATAVGLEPHCHSLGGWIEHSSAGFSFQNTVILSLSNRDHSVSNESSFSTFLWLASSLTEYASFI